QKGVLGFVPRPRWFDAAGECKLPAGIPLVDQGSSLSFVVVPVADGLLQFDLAIESRDRDTYFQIEHRRNDITPFLFSISSDGAAVEAKPQSGAVSGGVSLMK